MNKAIVLLSGGMDSLVTLSLARVENENVVPLHINYGQRTEKKELDCFFKICNFYNYTEYKVFKINYLQEIGGSSLIDNEMILETRNNQKKNVPNTYVPYRNGNFISIACSLAETILANRIYIGVVEVDGSGYPDCRSIFIKSLEIAINNGISLEKQISIKTPLINLSKIEIVKLGHELKAPFHLSWSCYQNDDVPCGICDSCKIRKNAFFKAGIDDINDF